jgi:hypothetical protein
MLPRGHHSGATGDQPGAFADFRRTAGVGTQGDDAESDGTALAGKRSIRFKAVLRKLVDTGI